MPAKIMIVPARTTPNYTILMPIHPNKDEQSRIGFYINWLNATGRAWYQPDLEAYRDYLLYERVRVNPHTGQTQPATLSPTTVQAYLATLRGRYQTLLRDNGLRQSLYALAPPDGSLADRKAFVDELLARLQNGVHPSTATVSIITKQDEADSDALRLKPHQVTALLRAPGIDTLTGIRDTAIIALLVCTGIREAELCDLTIADLRVTLGGELALRIREGKGSKQRLVPYGALDWCLLYVERWLTAAGITTGAVFRGIYKGGRQVRAAGLTSRTVNRILNQYVIPIDGALRDVKPHDLRRTYARNAYEQGMDLERLRQNLGHTSLQTTQGYIGTLDAHQRRPPMMFEAPHSLDELQHRWMME